MSVIFALENEKTPSLAYHLTNTVVFGYIQELESVGGEKELQRVMNSRNKARSEAGPRK
jgi:hypothetical protein